VTLRNKFVAYISHDSVINRSCVIDTCLSFTYRMANDTDLTCSDRPFSQVMVMVMEDHCSPFTVVPITKIMGDGQTLQDIVREKHGFDIAQQLTSESRQSPVVVDGWLRGGTVHAYIFLRIQEGKL
jgi:hypothetical protein